MKKLEVSIREKRFPPVGRAAAHIALKDLNMSVAEREFVCVLGPSGCGKTTMLNCIAGLDHDFDGRISLPRVPGHSEPVIGYVFQDPRLLPWRTVSENIELVLGDVPSRGKLIDGLLVATGLEQFRQSYPERLSLGMERRVSLARAFAVRPDVLLMDEPFVSLDEATATRLRRLLVKIWSERPTTVIFVTHDLREAIQLADRIVLLSRAPGSVIADLPIEVRRDDREDPEVIEAFRRRLFRDWPSLNGNF